jgi:sugar phosphate permease
LIANCCAIPFVIIAGKLSDKVSAKVLVPGGLIFQAIVFTLYCFVPNPTSWTAYALAVPQAGTVMIVIVTMQSYVSKRCPKNIRGMIFAVIGIFSALGCVAYLQTYNYLDKYGSWMAFGTIVIFDVVWLIILLIFIFMGKYGNPAPGTDADEDQEMLD